ncbi:MAG: FHA domain-containing protein [Spirochaetales bacterium]|nr:FHA domain-containing protein [Spirochaetales bacterium]
MSDKKYFLQGKTKGNNPLIIPLDKPETLIGRSKECSLILQAPSVSRKHAVIRLFGDDVYLKDLGSRNGCYINGVKIEEEEILRSSDIIRIGAMEFTFETGEPEEEEDDSEKTLIDVKKQQESDFVKQYALSAREEEVFYLLLKGLKVKEISAKLFISQGTAKNHVLSIYSKTDCHSRIELSHKYQEFN